MGRPKTRQPPVYVLCTSSCFCSFVSLSLQSLQNSLKHLRPWCQSWGELHLETFLGWIGEGVTFNAKRIIIFA